jgi:ribulose-5-phosphate 4-epimerase/fuculose-1-phosphate aldolase
MTDVEARAEICRVGRSLFDRGYVHATAGNISVRLDGGGYLITPTDACLGVLDPARLSRVDGALRHGDGDRPSKTIALHARIYAAAGAEASCVIHTHSTHCVALTLGHAGDELLAPITPYFVMKVGHVPVVSYRRPGAAETASDVANLIARYAKAGTPIRAVMLERLGPMVWHESPASAMAALEELEETARLVVLRGRDVTPLGEAQIEELRRTFGARW